MNCKPKLDEGSVFFWWTVLSAFPNPNPQSNGAIISYLCQCKCGTQREVLAHSLRSGASKSCGCYNRLVTSKLKRIHGEKDTPEYQAWKGIRNRCNNPKNKKYYCYGARGIKVCERWDSFPVFLADMGRRPSSNHSIGRLDNDGPYSPENCEWQLPIQQMNNMQKTIFIKHNGETRTASEWARVLNISPQTLYHRIERGWTGERLFSPPRR